MKDLSLKIKRNQLVQKHQDLVKQGKFYTANKIFDFLSYGYIYLGFDDISWECEKILEQIGFQIIINSRTGRANCRVHWRKEWKLKFKS